MHRRVIPMAKAKCNFECYNNGTCPFPDCITDGITPQERAEQNKRDLIHKTYGVIPYARQHRRTRGNIKKGIII